MFHALVVNLLCLAAVTASDSSCNITSTTKCNGASDCCSNTTSTASCNSTGMNHTLYIVADTTLNSVFIGGNKLTLRNWPKTYEVSSAVDVQLIELIAVNASDDGQSVSGILASVDGIVLITDGQWRCVNTSYINPFPPNWMCPDYDDSSWPCAVELDDNRNDRNGSVHSKHFNEINSTARWISTTASQNLTASERTIICRRRLAAVGRCVGETTSSPVRNITRGLTSLTQVRTSWGPVNVPNALTSLSQAVINDSTSALSVANSLVNLTHNFNSLQPADINLCTQILTKIAESQFVNERVCRLFIMAVDGLADVDPKTIREAQQETRTATRILSAIDALIRNIDLNETSGVLRVNGSRMMIDIRDLADDPGQWVGGLSDEDSASGILLSSETASAIRGNTTMPLRMGFIVYRNASFFIDKNNAMVSSPVVSCSFARLNVSNLTHPVTIVFSQQQEANESTCAYWDSAAENWSTGGMSLASFNSSTVVCLSNHLTNFAVIIGYDGSKDAVFTTVLETISLIGLSLSIAGLSLTILSHIVLFRTLRKSRCHMVILHLSIALLMVDIIVLVGVDKTQSAVGCKAVAALLLYFLLVSFSWMLVEAVLQYMFFVKVFNVYTSRFMVKAGLPAWIVPAVIVIVVSITDSLVSFHVLHGKQNYCWLAPVTFYIAFLVPLGLIMVTNVVLFVLIIKSLTCGQVSVSDTEQVKSELLRLKAVVLICCVIAMGLTWLFAFFAIDHDGGGGSRVMQVVFCVFNSLQGFLIFIFFNIREKVVRDAWRRIFPFCRERKQTKRRSSEALILDSTSSSRSDIGYASSRTNGARLSVSSTDTA